ncbi:uncharacterized protein VP01_3117g4 [Puccinia sorghi]|uniref:Uncharacterized protein n=1 Tax=Puccinia sorghi TaxID=27349 RepID=A0A0L6V052_9BASI|nr:uncharacterized protein VP01_3117g4 [Puccinia sorghi]
MTAWLCIRTVQVEEKIKHNIAAVNLTKMWLNFNTKKEIICGKYSFVYVCLMGSIKIYLCFVLRTTCSLKSFWQKIEFLCFCYVRHCESRRISDTENVEPDQVITTCQPVAVKAILNNLKIKEEEMDFHRDPVMIFHCFMELTLLSQIHVPTLVYYTTFALTLQGLTVLNEARWTPGGQNNPLSTFEDDPNIIRKKERLEAEGFPPCRCLNCDSLWLTSWENVIHVSKYTFDDFITNPCGLNLPPHFSDSNSGKL